MMRCVADTAPDHPHYPSDRRLLIERLNRARHEISRLEQALARLPESAPDQVEPRPAETPLPIAAG